MSATVRLELEGMTCAACASRIEKKLNKLDGVEATVNYATEQATVRAPETVSVDALVAAVESAGYGAHVAGGSEHAHDDGTPGRRLLAAAVLSAPVVVLGMAGWAPWAAFVLSTPVVFWAGLPFHRAALNAARHRAANMDTLISLGTLAAWTWSAVVLLGGLDADTYFEVAAAVTTLILLGRWLEARAKRRSSEAIRRLLELGAKEARVLRDGEEVPSTRRSSRWRSRSSTSTSATASRARSAPPTPTRRWRSCWPPCTASPARAEARRPTRICNRGATPLQPGCYAVATRVAGPDRCLEEKVIVVGYQAVGVAVPEPLDGGGEIPQEPFVVPVVVEECSPHDAASGDVVEQRVVHGTSTPATGLQLRCSPVAEV